MATFNISDIMVQAHKQASAMFRTTRTRNNGWGFGKTYRQIFVVYLRQEWAEEKKAVAKMNEKPESFSLRLDYSDIKGRGLVKSLGGKWNADAKIWTVFCRQSDLGTLVSKVAPAKNSDAGYMGKPVNFMRVRAGYEFDGIENA